MINRLSFGKTLEARVPLADAHQSQTYAALELPNALQLRPASSPRNYPGALFETRGDDLSAKVSLSSGLNQPPLVKLAQQPDGDELVLTVQFDEAGLNQTPLKTGPEGKTVYNGQGFADMIRGYLLGSRFRPDQIKEVPDADSRWDRVSI